MDDANGVLGRCDVLMLDMDGTVLDLAYDNFMWLSRIPEEYARRHGMPAGAAREALYGHYRRMQGTLEWYCLDHWSERLGIDVLNLHREHRDRIGYLPRARAFLEAVAGSALRVLLVTNSHRDTLSLKIEATGLDAFFDGIYSAHDLGHPKEEGAFWQALRAAEDFDAKSAVFVDDTAAVLRSARDFGLENVFHVTLPDTSRPARPANGFAGIGGIADLLCA